MGHIYTGSYLAFICLIARDENKESKIDGFDAFLVELNSPRWQIISKFNNIVCGKSSTVTFHV